MLLFRLFRLFHVLVNTCSHVIAYQSHVTFLEIKTEPVEMPESRSYYLTVEYESMAQLILTLQKTNHE